MEAFGVYYACSNCVNPQPKYFLSIKSISDRGDNKKNDIYQEYAAFTSAQYIYYLLTESDLFSL
jgi:nucleoside phosphorylase